MEFLPIKNLSSPFAVTAEQVLAMCQRAFGPGVRVISARELSGGTFNTTFQITLDDQPVILRVAPPDTADLAWDEEWLMRREYAIQPFFAPVASLMPRFLMADFTQQVLKRDYCFQSYLRGERWDALSGELNSDEELSLWEQFGRITKTIHQITGSRFGGSQPAPEFQAWSQAVIHRLENAAKALVHAQMDAGELQFVLEIVRAQTGRLDEIRQPHLLHGDLWLFNILVDRGAAGAKISGILDADRAWWGDPLADWTMFVLAKSEDPAAGRFHEAFWQAYGKPELSPGNLFRMMVYEALNIGTTLAWAKRHDDEETIQRGRQELANICTTLPTL